MSFNEIYDQSIREGLMKRIADDILQGITKVREQPGISSRRWLWELMQNARDVPNKWDGVSIKIILDQNSIKICHNGDPFSLKNLNNLIMQVSSKSEENDDDAVGKFGTGFLVTHLLSKKLNLSGILKLQGEEFYQFKIHIDRSADTSKQLQKNLEDLLLENKRLDANEHFLKVPNYAPSEHDFKTVFEFPLDGESLVYAKAGIKDLVNTLPLTLIFTKKIKSVEIENTIENSKYSFKKNTNDSTPVKAINTNNGTQYFWIKSTDQVSVALRVKDLTDKTPIPWPDNTPKLYRDFPLIGSEDFHSAFVTHSSDFSPDEKRSGLLLTDTTNPKVQQNRHLLINAYNDIIRNFITEIGDTPSNYLLAESRVPQILRQADDETKTWYENQIQIPHREFLLENLSFVTAKETAQKLKDIRIPHYEKGSAQQQDDFYNVVQGFYNLETLPQKTHYRKWLNVINTDYEKWNKKLLLHIQDLENTIVSKRSLSGFTNITYPQLLNSFNLFFDFLNRTGNADIIQKKRLIPNDKGEFRNLSELWVNDNIQEIFLDIIETEIPNYRSKNLIHKQIDVKLSHKKLSSNDILKEIIEIISLGDYGLAVNQQLKTIYKLLQLQYSDKANFRSKLFEQFCKFFNFERKPLFIENENDLFNFDPIVKVALNILFSKVSNLKTSDELARELSMDLDEAMQWLNSLIMLVHDSNTHRDILNNYRIFPNYYGELISFEKLFKIEGASVGVISNLINFHEDLLPNRELKMHLIHSDIEIKVSQLKNVSEICGDLDEKVKTYYSEWSDIADEEKTKVFNLLEWASSCPENQIIFKHHFNWLQQNRASIFMEQLESPEVKDAMFSIMKSDTDTILAVGEMMKSSSAEQIRKLGKINIENFSRIDKLLDGIEEGDIKEIEKFAEEKKEERTDFNFKKHIGDSFEKLFKDYFEKQNFNFTIQKMENPADFKIANGDRFYYVELKSLAANAETKIVKMSYNQAVGATTFKNDYALCILERPVNWKAILNGGQGFAFISQNTKVVKDIGSHLERGFLKSKDFKKTLLEGNIDGVGVEFKNNDFKLTVQSDIWNHSTSIQDLFSTITEKLS